MDIKGITLIQRDGKGEFTLKSISENGHCHLTKNTPNTENGLTTTVTLPMFHILNQLNTPNGSWSLKIAPDKYIEDSVVWIKGRLLNGYGTENGFSLVEVLDAGSRPEQLYIKNNHHNQIRVRILK